MKIHSLLIFSLLALSVSPAVAAEQTPEQKYKEVASRAGAPTAVLRYGADDLRSGQLRLPSGKGPFPVAVIVHGGCWTASFDTMAGTAAVAEALSKRGIATWNIEYRRLGDEGAGWPGTFEDVGAGIDFVETLAKIYPLDLTRVTVVGHSAGAHLALWGASRARLGAGYASRVHPVSAVQIDGVASLAPFVGLDTKTCGRPVISDLMGGSPDGRAEEYRLASPAAHLPLGIRQLLVQGAFRPFMAPYAEAARKAGDYVEVLEGTDDHFDVVTPGTPGGDKVIDFITARAFVTEVHAP